MEDKTDIFGEFGIWVWGKSIPSDVDKCQEFMRMSPLGKYIKRLEKENKDKVKENDDLREQLHKEVFRKLQAQPNALKASEVKPKPLSKQKIEEIVTDWHSDEYGTIESLAEAIYLTQGEEE